MTYKLRKDLPLYIKVIMGSIFTFIIFAIVSVTLYFAGYPLFYLNTTKSAPLGIYLSCPFDKDYKYNDFVIVKLDKDYGKLKKGELLLKRVKGLPKDVYVREQGKLVVRGEEFPIVESNLLPQLNKGNYFVHEGEILLLNNRDNSFDGRYIGAMKKSDIVQKVILIFNREEFWKKERRFHDLLADKLPFLREKDTSKSDGDK